MSKQRSCTHVDYPPEAGVLCDECILRKTERQISDLEKQLAEKDETIKVQAEEIKKLGRELDKLRYSLVKPDGH